jgi:hypothetical protein
VDDDDDGDGDDGDDDDDFVPLTMRGIPSFSSLILPSDGLRWLGFCLLDEFLESLHVRSMIHFDGVKIADLPEAAVRQTTTHASVHGRMERRRSLWKRDNSRYFGLLACFFYGKCLSPLIRDSTAIFGDFLH